jgi:hypothetical protein
VPVVESKYDRRKANTGMIEMKCQATKKKVSLDSLIDVETVLQIVKLKKAIDSATDSGRGEGGISIRHALRSFRNRNK